MVLVALAALTGAIIFLLFRWFAQRNLPILPIIALNYWIAFVCGALHTKPWAVGPINELWVPSIGLGILFVAVFSLTAISTQRAGIIASTVAAKLSLVVTVLYIVVVHAERPTLAGWSGIGCALIAIPLATRAKSSTTSNWQLPTLLLLGTAGIEILISNVQRLYITPATEGVFPTLCFIWAGTIALLVVGYKGILHQLFFPAILVVGIILGAVNYLSLLFVVQALAHSGMGASTVFPLLSIGVILLSTLGALLIFKDKPNKAQWAGIGLAVVALGLLIKDNL